LPVNFVARWRAQAVVFFAFDDIFIALIPCEIVSGD